ncbi:hypothetical protein GUITHDRAFT_84349 [Guillardia theta CCMP2712]|uniref:PITH domain-containing protein n=1 Tax=Guillardia theta (strain CCMP2712) TaxID=905079 RepID=L1JY95_GUITC|nr:hypothetical protein GUITHDRAFT_84349 [Guillardia theta CCMP2712]EKX53195.1 hypothetical protein GUITHDRAFT_84349 [Guillardia theta CCMP2712]|eukprot:XP_005840175.1 hypothetical protein GUITHDRAFT_84349 [Guillardia theta CCMP2712]
MSSEAEIKDLSPLFDMNSLECLNQDSSHVVTNCMKQGPRDDDAVFLASDCDEQLLINLRFKQAVRLHSIAVKAIDADKAPKHLKLFSNPVNMSFDSAESDQCTQEVEFTPEQVADGTVINLRYVKFQNVTSLSLFVGKNFGNEDQTVIHKLMLYGTAGNNTNMGDWEKVAKKAMENQ